jgi:hypothetical protein
MNWSVDERVRYRCPECQTLVGTMVPECPYCHTIMSEKPDGDYKRYKTGFGMNGGSRKEYYDLLLTKEEYKHAQSLTDPDLYRYIVNDMWDRVTNAYIDAGTDYEGLCGEIEEVEP